MGDARFGLGFENTPARRTTLFDSDFSRCKHFRSRGKTVRQISHRDSRVQIIVTDPSFHLSEKEGAKGFFASVSILTEWASLGTYALNPWACSVELFHIMVSV